MKKLMTVLALAGVLSVPSAVFAEATWYGSLRPTIEVGGGMDARMGDGGSRWGIRGSSEVSEGLTAVYRFEHKLDTKDAGQPGGRLAYAGLSGSFGTLTMGQVWSASYNATGAITDNSWFYGKSATSYRVGNAVSYAVSAGSLSMQIDSIMDAGSETDRALDQLEFGLTVDLGDIGKVAFAHVNKENDMVHTDNSKIIAHGGSRANHVAVQVGFGGVTTHLGLSETKSNGVDTNAAMATVTKTTVTHYGVAGSLGDTGLSYLVQARKVDDGMMKSSPWLLAITKSLGGGATAMIEHGNSDDGMSGKTQFGLKVDF